MYEQVIITFIGFAGLLLSTYLFYKKQNEAEHISCPLHGNCDEVMRSRYSKFFGVPVEILGMLYYSIITLGYVFYIFVPVFRQISFISPVLLFVSTFALVFSFYLTFIQFAALKKLCTWCLVSATFCLFIFLLSFQASATTVFPILTLYEEPIELFHLLGVTFGIFGATFSCIFLHKFLNDYRISKEEASILDIFSQTIWLSIGIIIMTGLALFVPRLDVYLESSLFLLKLVIFSVVVLSGALLNLLVSPRLIDISFGNSRTFQDKKLDLLKRLFFLLGPISLSSWYVLFILVLMKSISYSFNDAMVFYTFFVIVSVYFGHVIHCHIDQKSKNQSC